MSPVVTLLAPAAGLNSDAAATALSTRQAPLLQNFLPGRAGKVVMRGGMAPTFATPGVGYAHPSRAGFQVFDDNTILIGQFNAATFRRLDVTGPTATFAAAAAAYAGGGGTAGIYGSSARVGDILYFLPPSNNLIAWTGDPPAAPELFIVAHAPPTSHCITAHLNRVFMAGGTNSAILDGGANTLMWSTDGGPLTDNVDERDWKNAGIFNYLRFGTQDDKPIALQSYDARTLLIHCLGSTFGVFGTNPDNFTVRKVNDYGIRHTTSCALLGGAAFWLAPTGLVMYDGATTRLVSAPVADKLRTSPSPSFLGTVMLSEGDTSMARLDGDNLAVCVPGWTGIYNLPTNAWSELNSPAFTPGEPSGVFQAGDIAYFYDDGFIYDATAVALGEDASLYAPYSRDNSTANATASGTPLAIPATFRTAVARLASPPRKASIRRVMVDYLLIASSATPPSFAFTLEDDDANVLFSATLPALASGSTRRRQRLVFDVFVEDADEVCARFVYTRPSSGADATVAEVLDTFVEFDPIQNRTG